MRIKQLIPTLVLLATLACGAEPTPIPPAPTATVAPTPTTPSAPVSRSDIETTFSEPLSSGLSIADVTENALPSVAHIVTGTGSGTGFIVNESGLVVTNKHVVDGSSQVSVRMAEGNEYMGRVTQRHPTLDLAYVSIDSSRTFTPIAVGDSDEVRVGAEVIAIGFPLGSALGSEPTVSVGIISAKRDDRLQTDASLNPGNSGGPLLDMFGQVVGVVVSRVETDSAGRPISGIGFAIPINEVKTELGDQVSPAGKVVPTPTPFPEIGPTPDLEATKKAIEAVDAFRRESEKATRTAVEAQATAQQYAADLEATRVAELPTATPTATPTPTPTPTPHPQTHCVEWESMVGEWIAQGNIYYQWNPAVPEHPNISAEDAHRYCITEFPVGILVRDTMHKIGDGENELLPGLYEYRREGDNRVGDDNCGVLVNAYLDVSGYIYSEEPVTEMPHGEMFSFKFLANHQQVGWGWLIPGYTEVRDSEVVVTEWGIQQGASYCDGAFYRIGD